MTEITEFVSLQESRESQSILWIILLTTAVTAFADRLYLELVPSLALGVIVGYVPVAVAPIMVERVELVDDDRRLLVSWSLLFASAYMIYMFSAWSRKLHFVVGSIVVVGMVGTIFSIAQVRGGD